MTKNECLSHIAAIISALNETGGSPESMLYVFCNMNMDEYQTIRDILTSNPAMVKIVGNYVTLTPYGKEMAEKIDAVIAAKRDVK